MSHPDPETASQILLIVAGNDPRVTVRISERADKKKYFVRVLIEGEVNDNFDTDAPTFDEAMSILRGYVKFIQPKPYPPTT